VGLQLCRRVGLVILSNARSQPQGRNSLAAHGPDFDSGRLCNPSSELHIAEHFYESSALSDLLGVAAEKVNETVSIDLGPTLAAQGSTRKTSEESAGGMFEPITTSCCNERHQHILRRRSEADPLAQRVIRAITRPDCKQVKHALWVVSREEYRSATNCLPGTATT